jgi:PAS domain-containing protein
MTWITEQDRQDRESWGQPSVDVEVRFFRKDGTYFDKTVRRGTEEYYAERNGLRAGMASWNYGLQRVYE